ncbi:hypothetical protein BU26DRAFT_598856 [Trematosphaeria pertusa]|uniref:Uncharacterized protein n=1 Tax=Trematosphaeria pertusa TaxID=390896 RepID=A0A6A6J2F6_9PLEO|nr:uncharacterized protein BU26DRAFT_598856 [Trematosphaeria pertusa]KAF2256090.1 hypothetical protein BU26DRAFT_598856 [Trematosphaeria pertusa]
MTSAASSLQTGFPASATGSMHLSISSIATIPTALPGVCNPSVAPALGNQANVSHPYCQFNWEDRIPNLSDCCNDDAEVHVWNNCTQYCESDRDVMDWRECIVDKVPAADDQSYFFACISDNPQSPDVTAITGTRTPSSSGISETGSSGSSSASGTASATESRQPQDTGAAQSTRPPATFMGWLVVGLALAFGFNM